MHLPFHQPGSERPQGVRKRNRRRNGGKPPPKKAKIGILSGEKPKTNENAYSTGFPLASDEAPHDELSILPAEILQLILESVGDKQSMVKMACTSKRYYFLVSCILHKRISVCVNHYAHICKVIRRLEPHLSIAQKKLLKKEGEYKGQQEKFSESLDLNAVPPCANGVRQMIVGSVNPGRKNKPIIMRYLDEVMKNLHNLEVFEGHNFTESMSKSLATQKNLKSLYISFHESRCFEDNAFNPLAEIRGLEHLRVEGFGMVNGEKVVSSMLLNSLTTLESLKVSASWLWSGFMDNWEEDFKAYDPKSWEQIPHFTCLRSLSLSQIIFNSKLTRNLGRAVDFLRLEKLEINHFGDQYKDIGKKNMNGHLEFFQYLEALFHRANKADIHLRKLSLQVSGYWRKQRRKIEEDLGHIYRFMSSFDTLICLEIHNYNTYRSDAESNPGLLQQLRQSILKHKELETLHFHYRDVLSGHEVPCVTAASVEVLVKNLPKLRVLEFAPSGDNKDKMLQALSGAENLTTLIFSPQQTLYPRSDFPEDYHDMVIQSVIEGFMEHASCSGEFIWEKQYKLSKFRIDSAAYVIGSSLKRRKGWFEYGPVKVAKGDRTVMFQNLLQGNRFSQDNPHYVPDSQWVHEVTKPNNPAQFI